MVLRRRRNTKSAPSFSALSWLAISACLSFASRGALAAGAEGAERDTALDLAHKADGFAAQGDHENALALYVAAYQLARVPTLGLEIAKSQVALGKLVEAKATADEVIRLPVKPGEPLVLSQARAAAAELSLALTQRIPTISFLILPIGTKAHIELDGVELKPSSAGSPSKVNPGTRHIRVESTGYDRLEQDVELAEGEHRKLELQLNRDASGGAAPPLASPPSADAAATGDAAETAREPIDSASSGEGGISGDGLGKHRINLGLQLGLGGQYLDYTTDSAPAYGLAGAYEVRLAPAFSLAVELGMLRWSNVDLNDDSEESGVLGTLLLKPKLWLLPSHGKGPVDLYLGVALGANFGSWFGGTSAGAMVGLAGKAFTSSLVFVEFGPLALAREVAVSWGEGTATEGALVWRFGAGIQFSP